MNHKNLLEVLADNSMQYWAVLLEKQLDVYFDDMNHGDYSKWQLAINSLPSLEPSSIVLNTDCITIGDQKDSSEDIITVLEQQLKILMPWRKGPFSLFGIKIDAEWRSNLKWSRLAKHIRPLKGRMVLDVGCGNGYYGWRMLGEEAKHVVGLDPTLLFYMQFNAIKKYVHEAHIHILPFGIQKLPEFALNFDTVFSMGVIYHRRNPIEHLKQLKRCLKSNGELILETLIIESDKNEVLKPKGRYAKMNNVWAIPSTLALIDWAEQAGYHNVRIVDVANTTSEEQHRTEWMRFESLSDFLNIQDNTKTIEGYSRPRRAIVLAEKP
jgi:tRNA (mo5U34)-methyltransferase